MHTMHTRVEVDKMSPGFIAWYADESARVPQYVMENMVRSVAATDLYDRLPDIIIATLILAPNTALLRHCVCSASCGVASLILDSWFSKATVTP